MEAKAVRRVCVQGGTHGNEPSGVYLVKKWERNDKELRRTSFDTKFFLANPKAIALNQRYKDCDLNLQFGASVLGSEPSPTDPYEVQRAREIQGTMVEGGKIGPCDVILDLHNTTANVKLTLIYWDSPDDVFCSQMIRYVMDQYPPGECYALALETLEEKQVLTKHRIAIEVGPQPQGVLRGDVFLLQQEAVKHSLDFVEKYNSGFEFPETTLPVFEIIKRVSYPNDEKKNIVAMVHPNLQDQDWKPIRPDDAVFLHLDGRSLSLKEIYPESVSLADAIYPCFINEGSYYRKNMAFKLATKTTKNVKKLTIEKD